MAAGPRPEHAAAARAAVVATRQSFQSSAPTRGRQRESRRRSAAPCTASHRAHEPHREAISARARLRESTALAARDRCRPAATTFARSVVTWHRVREGSRAWHCTSIRNARWQVQPCEVWERAGAASSAALRARATMLPTSRTCRPSWRRRREIRPFARAHSAAETASRSGTSQLPSQRAPTGGGYLWRLRSCQP